MNRRARAIINELESVDNQDNLRSQLLHYFNDPQVAHYLRDHFNTSFAHFIQTVTADLGTSDPMPGVTLYDQIVAFNDQFVKSSAAFIQTHVVGDTPAQYSVNDGAATSRNGCQLSPDDTLARWRRDSGRGIQSRDDSADYYGIGGSGNACGVGGGCSGSHTGARDGGIIGASGPITGITFCDQSGLNTHNHLEQYENTFHKNVLNNTARPHETTAFGVSNCAADSRLLSRRVFRSNEAGVESGITRREARLTHRHIDRDVGEGLRGGEYGSMVLGYDMSTLHARVDHRRAMQAKYASPPSQMRLGQTQGDSAVDPRYR
jgi:hypothetical protein